MARGKDSFDFQGEKTAGIISILSRRIMSMEADIPDELSRMRLLREALAEIKRIKEEQHRLLDEDAGVKYAWERLVLVATQKAEELGYNTIADEIRENDKQE